MTPTPPSEVDLFAEAIERSGPERIAFLDDACRSDPGLRARLEELLAAHEGTEGSLATAGPPWAGLAPEESAVGPDEAVGQEIGRYRILEQVGEGGWGVVYVAEQTEPVRRRVALKVIKLGMDTKAVVARFEAERQALALMDHANIARVLDAGATSQGRPFFVMEFVPGLRITDYCDQHRLDVGSRLDLFIKVCHAIQHAHQKGIIHRDIKPSNILVVRQDGVPVPKVIDFGIAKATGGKLTDATLHTHSHQFMGTPAYMSPEQAGTSPGAAGDIDTRSDIYSLGVLLYELLTGRTPFDPAALMAQGLEGMRKTIREQAPVRPSAALALMSAADQATVTQCRGTSPAKLSHRLRGDLDWVVLKCLEKDRAQRYETPSDLASDVQRHLDREPVLARRPSVWYRLQRSIQRHRLTYASAALVLAALVGGLGVAVWGLVREREARQQADLARQQAEAARILASAESARNEQVARFFMGAWGGAAFWRDQDPVFARRFLDRMSAGAQLFLADQPALQGDLRVGLGNSYAAIRDYPTAITNLQQAIEGYQKAFGTQHVRLALATAQLGRIHQQAGDMAAAGSNALRSVAIARRSQDPEALADCLLHAAKSMSRAEVPGPAAIPLLREAMELRRHAVPHLLALLDSTRQLVKALEGLVAEGREAEARAILAEELRKAPKDGDLRKLQRKLGP